MKKIIWSSYQKDIFRNIGSHNGHMIVEAKAGSAKTTSLIEAVKYIPSSKKILITAFNKSIQEELEKRIQKMNVETKTFHSLGLRAITQNFGKPAVDSYKVQKILKSLLGSQTNYDLLNNLSQAISFCKYSLNDSPSHIDYLVDRFGIDCGELSRKEFISIVIKALGSDKKETGIIDFDDMCWFPFVYNMRVASADYVLIDEFQDLNKSQLIMAKSALKPEGKLVFFGDSLQNLYSWRLTDNTIIKEVAKEPTTKILPLPISYRCPKNIIKLAKNVAKDITCPDDAIEGSIEEISINQMYEQVKPGSVILSRVNAPLIKICLRLLKQGKRCNILGRDIGDGLLMLVKKSKKKQIPAFLSWLEKWKNEEVKRLKEKNISQDNLLDRVECLVNLAEDSSSIANLQEKIKELFDDSDHDNIVICSSVHRFKGKQAHNIYVLKWTLRYWPVDGIAADTEDEEARIAYVSWTRTQDKLYFVSKF